MAERTIYAEILLDDSIAFNKNNMEPIEYLEKEFKPLEQNGIKLHNCVIIDFDCDIWDKYLNYLFQWALDNADGEKTDSPLLFNDWKKLRKGE